MALPQKKKDCCSPKLTVGTGVLVSSRGQGGAGIAGGQGVQEDALPSEQLPELHTAGSALVLLHA